MIKVSYLVLAILVMARTPQYISDRKKDFPVISELESDRAELPIQYAPGLFLIDIRQEEWFLVSNMFIIIKQKNWEMLTRQRNSLKEGLFRSFLLSISNQRMVERMTSMNN